jgi:hypothetical protein
MNTLAKIQHKMKDLYCPLCYSKLETIDVAPCMDCGSRPEEIQHALNNTHTYSEVRVYEDLTLILCDFCQVDFGSYHPEFFGLPKDKRIDRMHFLRSIELIHVGKDKVCLECGYRLPFLKFIRSIREINKIKFKDE